jgi:PAS domain S-box-containing protein
MFCLTVFFRNLDPELSPILKGAFLSEIGLFWPAGITFLLMMILGINLILFRKTHRLKKQLEREKKLERKLSQSRMKFRKAFDASPDMLGISSMEEGRFIEVNREFLKKTGYCKEEVIGKTSLELGLWVSPGEREEAVKKLKEQKNLENIQVRYRMKSGEIRYFLTSAETLELDGEPCIMVWNRDITELKKTQEKLRESEKAYRLLAENTADLIWTMDMDLNLTYLSPSVKEILDYQPEELLGKKPWNLLTEQGKEKALEILEKELIQEKEKPGTGKRQRFSLEQIRKDGKKVWTELQTSFLRNGEGKAMGIMGVTRDVTVRKEMEEALLQNEAKYRAVVENSEDVIARFDRNCRYLFVSPSIEFYTGHKPEHYLNKTPSEADFLKKLSLFWESEIRKIFQTGKPEKSYFEFKNKKEDFYFDWLLIPEIVEKGKVKTVLSYVRNITSLVEARKTLEKAVEEKEMLLKELHHRIKNNLQTIYGLLQIQTSTVKDDQVRKILKETENRIFSMALIHQKLYEAKTLSSVDLTEYLEELAEGMIKSYGIDSERIHFEIRGEPVNLGTEQIVPCSLIFTELVTNSIKYAFPDNRKGTIFVDISRDDFRIKLKIGDDGVGFPKDFDRETSDSLGLELIELLGQQLEGRVQKEEDGKKEGTWWKIEFPLKKRQE